MKSRLKFSISLETFNLARNFNIDLLNSPPKKGFGGRARLKLSIPEGDLENYFNLCALRDGGWRGTSKAYFWRGAVFLGGA